MLAVKSHNVLVKHLKLKTNHEDFEFKKLLINLMVVLSKQPTIIHVSSDIIYQGYGMRWKNFELHDPNYFVSVLVVLIGF